MPKKIIPMAAIAASVTMALHAQGPKNIPPAMSNAPKYGYSVVRSYPHDPKAFTQGLEYFGGLLYEGVGLKGRSALRKVELETGKVLQEEKLHPQYFGEGITISQGKVFQVTWKDKTGFIYDAKTLKFIRNFSYFGEGWGLAHDPAGLIMSDGTSVLRFFEPTRFREQRRVKVMDGGVPIEGLNELEWVRGEIWANVWGTDYIVRISPKDGRVVGWINLKGLLTGPEAKLGPDAVLNGIAYDSPKNRIFVTGKLWPRLFEIMVK
ncbi:MAG TPA: glutaminyl-peptide cyclotransferase [Vicinamibacterales bacterium]|nr:glutaminyl-peptide cyclotransferase [Vicinamibacterales bacterium]